jgi:hypothetical protein
MINCYVLNKVHKRFEVYWALVLGLITDNLQLFYNRKTEFSIQSIIG